MRFATIFILALVAMRGDTLKEILDRMDGEAARFTGVTTDFKRADYNPVFKDTTVSTGVLQLVKGKKGVAALFDFAAPDAKQYLFRDNLLQEYLPKLNLVNEYDMGKSAAVVNQFATLAFGSSGKELQKSYTMEQRGTEVLKIADKEVKVTKVELVPKAAEALKMVKKIEFWIPEGKSYAVQMKAFQPSGDTNTATYTSVQLNPPGLSEHSIVLKAPKNAKHEKINK
jgi:outer membrane lipoprotein-sorting protein